jgi:protein-arginine kinase activator protein McsA
LYRSRDAGTLTVWIYGKQSVILGYEEVGENPKHEPTANINGNQKWKTTYPSEFTFHADLSKKEIDKLKKIPTCKTPKLSITNHIVQAYFYYKDLGIDLEIQKIEQSAKAFFNQENISGLENHILELEGDLSIVLDNEEYEKAAIIRDEIVKLKRKINEIEL